MGWRVCFSFRWNWRERRTFNIEHRTSNGPSPRPSPGVPGEGEEGGGGGVAVVSGADSEREADWGVVVFGVWSIFYCAGLGAKRMVVRVDDFGIGDGIALVCGASGDQESARIDWNACKLRITNRKSSYNWLDGLSG